MTDDTAEDNLTLQDAHMRARELAREGGQSLVQADALYRDMLAAISANGLDGDRLAGFVRADSWAVRQQLRRDPRYFSAAGQDEFLDSHVFGGLKQGTFVEVGAYDGVTGSNCLFFELFRQWSGLMIEASPENAKLAAENRQVPMVSCAVAPETGEEDFFLVTGGYTQTSGLVRYYDDTMKSENLKNERFQSDIIRVSTKPLADILRAHDMRSIDYISLDIEGAELDVLATFPFDAFKVTAWTIENNSGSDDIRRLMAEKGYDMVIPIGTDEVYARHVGPKP